MANRTYVSFDWAAKKLLRQKSNFIILEGFLSALLNEEITIIEILESESNKNDEADKYNRVDMLAKNSKEEQFLMEVQYDGALDYFHRMMYGTSKLVVDHLGEGMAYKNIKKVYAVHIIYFDLGQGSDYVYHGTTRFTGLHNHQELMLSDSQKQTFLKEFASDLFPEYYLIRVNYFDKLVETPLDEWVQFFKNDFIREDTTTKGLPEAKEQLIYSKLSRAERAQYDNYIHHKRMQHSVMETKYFEGKKEGKEEGIEEGIEIGREEGIEIGRKQGREEGIEIGEERGIEKGIKQIAKTLKEDGETDDKIALITGLTLSEVKEI